MNDHPLNILKDIKKPTRLQDHLGCDSITNRMFQRNDQSNDKNDQSLEYFKGY